MKEESLSLALHNSISEDASNILAYVSEVGLDKIMDEGFLKDISIVPVTMNLYKIGKSISERHYVRKLAQFVLSLNDGAPDEDSRNRYKCKLMENNKTRDQELEYILILIDRYISHDKPDMLAKIYLMYLREEISWIEFVTYSEAIDRFLPGDKETICSYEEQDVTYRNAGLESILRLASLGLVCEVNESSMFREHSNGKIAVFPSAIEKFRMRERIFKRTELGEKLARILR